MIQHILRDLAKVLIAMRSFARGGFEPAAGKRVTDLETRSSHNGVLKNMQKKMLSRLHSRTRLEWNCCFLVVSSCF